jgi:hypothetical protein
MARAVIVFFTVLSFSGGAAHRTCSGLASYCYAFGQCPEDERNRQ